VTIIDEKPKRDHQSAHSLRYRSLFWPVILISAGLVLLLANLGIIGGQSIAAIAQVWPLFLIVIGLDLLFGRESPVVGLALGIGAVVVVLLTALVGPALGLGAGAAIETRNYNAELGATERVDVMIDAGSAPLTVRPQGDSPQLVAAQIIDYSGVTFDVMGGRTAQITVQEYTSPTTVFGLIGDGARSWDIGLHPDPAYAFDLDLGSGDTLLELSNMDQLESLILDGGSGALEVFLPPAEARYTVRGDMSGGRWGFNVPEATQLDFELTDAGSGGLTMNVFGRADVSIRTGIDSGAQTFNIIAPANVALTATDGGSGLLTINVPDNAAVRLEILDDGSGSLSLPSWLVRVDGRDDEGTWQSDGFAEAEYQITIRLEEVTSGDIVIR
jgi:hypothetical protein